MCKTQTTMRLPPPPAANVEVPGAGVALLADAHEMLASELALAQFREQVCDVLAGRLPLAIRIAGLGDGQTAVSLFGRVCAALAAAAAASHRQASGIEIAIAAEALPPESAWLQRRQFLGDGPLYLLTGESLLQPRSRSSPSECYDSFWLQLWRLHDEGQVRAAYAPLVTSQCPLLSAETADAVLPLSSIQVPGGSAWVTMRLNLSHFADARGSLNRIALRDALHRCVDSGDALHERFSWPTASMRHDAWLNRRLAIEINGIGDLVIRRRHDPRCFSCLQRLSDLLFWVQATLRERSRVNAIESGNLPALGHSDPTRGLPDGRVRDVWCKRWSAALDQNPTRHRNLLVLSPWSMFPGGNIRDAGYLDLLPLLDYADACAFPAPPPLQGWNVSQFKNLHQRAWAVLERKGTRRLIAEQV